MGLVMVFSLLLMLCRDYEVNSGSKININAE